LTKIHRALAVLVCPVGAVALLWALGQLKIPAQTLLWGQLMNFGHVPLFAVLASCALGFCLGLLGDSMSRPRLYLVALSWSLVLAGVSEVLQVLDNRDVEVCDFLRNAAGTVCALALWASLDRGLDLAGWPDWRKRLRWIAVAILLSTLIPLAVLAESYRRMERRVPVLFRFDSALELPFVRGSDASLELVRAPEGWTEYAKRRVGRVTFRLTRYPTLTIVDLHRDWSGYRFLEWDLFLEAGPELEVILRVEDVEYNGRYRDRFNVKLPLRPGPNELRIPLEEVREAPEGRAMDMERISRLMLYLVRPEAPVSLYVAEMKLVGIKEDAQ
jgi:hypothetical protein